MKIKPVYGWTVLVDPSKDYPPRRGEPRIYSTPFIYRTRRDCLKYCYDLSERPVKVKIEVVG